MNNYAEEYITKATAQEVVKDVFRVDTITQEVIDTCMKCMTAIKNAPSADVRKNVKGEWIYSTNNESVCEEWTCSLCGIFSLENTNFCPNCGAQMKEE